MKVRPKAFLSISLHDDDKGVRAFFEDHVRSLGFEPFVYDFPEAGELSGRVIDHIRECECFIAVLTPREGSLPPPWVQHETAVARVLDKPGLVIAEEDVKVPGLLADMPCERFRRDDWGTSISRISKRLVDVKDLLDEMMTPRPSLRRDKASVRCEMWSQRDATWTVSIQMTALGDVRCFRHSSTATDAPHGLTIEADSLKFQVTDIPKQVRWERRVLTESGQKLEWYVYLTPPLREGEQMAYFYRREGSHTRPFTKEQAEARAKDEQSYFDDAVSYTCFSIAYPTKMLDFTLSLPKGYRATPRPPRVTRMHTREEVPTETARVGATECFDPGDAVADQLIMSLKVRNPSWGCQYWLVWDPPREADIPSHLLTAR